MKNGGRTSISVADGTIVGRTVGAVVDRLVGAIVDVGGAVGDCHLSVYRA